MAKIQSVAGSSSSYSFENPQQGIWWHYAGPGGVQAADHDPSGFGKVMPTEEPLPLPLSGKELVRVAPSEDCVSQWALADPGGKLLLIDPQTLSPDEWYRNSRSGNIVVLGEAAARKGEFRSLRNRHVAIGCDVGSGKGGTLFDGAAFRSLTPQELEDEFSTLRSHSDFLIAWDSPLTGPAEPDGRLDGGRQDLTQRPIESFFRRAEWKFKTPKGISVLSYSGCSHWAISQRILGLPRMGPYSSSYDKLPCRLISKRSDLIVLGDTRAAIVEVHPAVAIWLWCRNAIPQITDWIYKKSRRR